MMAANENEDPDIEFPIRDGKDPAVHARPAFGDPDKYEETTSAPKPEKTVNKVRGSHPAEDLKSSSSGKP